MRKFKEYAVAAVASVVMFALAFGYAYLRMESGCPFWAQCIAIVR